MRHMFIANRLYGVFLCFLIAGPFAGLSRAEQPLAVANYKQALKFNDAYLRQFTYDQAVTPNWIGKTETFWYSFRTSKGTNYYRVDPKQGKKEPLFDRVKLGSQLAELTQKPLDPTMLTLTRASMNEEGTKLKFVADDNQYEYDLPAEKLTKLGKAPAQPTLPQGFGRGGGQRGLQDNQQLNNTQQKGRRGTGGGGRGAGGATSGNVRDHRNYSPDRKMYVFAKTHNLYLVENDKENEAVQLTTDGIEDYSFGGGNDERKVRPTIFWSTDSKAFYVTRSDTRGVKELFVVNSLATPRPTLEKYKYPMPGEDTIRKTELFLFNADTKKVTKLEPKWKDEIYISMHWGKTADELRFFRRDRLRRHLEFCSLNVKTGEARCLIAEGFENAGIEYLPVRYIDETDELIWWSERSGWGHFYLYDRNGKLKNAITSGPFRANRIVAVDPKNRVMFFQANAREPGENVYLQHLYSIHLDGTGLTLMDPGNANHVSSLSPARQYVVDNCNRVDMAPLSVLRDASGKVIMELEKADISRLQEVGWKLPETFVVKAADGMTDLFGNMWKPFDFDPKKKYPIICHVYPGPQTEGVTHTFAVGSGNQQLAQLGFIVIQVGHRGGTPTRSKAYASYGYYNLRDYGLADKKIAVEQLAARYPFIDIDRVGIYGHSGGGFMSAAALLQKPYNDFFKVAVASAGNHDNNIYNDNWAERYHGLKEVPAEKKETGEPAPIDTKFEIKVPTNAELADNLKGRLLLVHGEVDNNVHPANTMRLVDALIKANKRFDMLILPGKRHGFADYQPYFTQRMWEFFSEHLIGDRQMGADLPDRVMRNVNARPVNEQTQDPPDQ